MTRKSALVPKNERKIETMYVLIIAAALGIIPGKIAERKGHSFWLWWFYGWMLFIFAIIHVQFIEDYNAPVLMKNRDPYNSTNNNTVYYNQPSLPPVRSIGTAEELMKYKQLMDAGAMTQEEYNIVKGRLLGLEPEKTDGQKIDDALKF